MPLQPNLGECPPHAKGKRVRVVLENGYDTAPREPGGWPADGREGCDWRLRNHPFAIKEFEVI